MRILIYLVLLLLVEVHSQDTYPYVSFVGYTLANHSYWDLSLVARPDVDNGGSLECYTDLGTCCSGGQGIHRGDWYFPDGTRLQFAGSIFENRGAQVVDLRRNSDFFDFENSTGIYRCDIPTNAVHDVTNISVRASIYMGLYTETDGDVMIMGNSINLTVNSDLNGPTPQFTLTCVSTGGPATTVQWTRNSTTSITEGTETVLNDPVTAQYTHTLTVSGREPGEYTCTVANNKPSSANGSITIEEASSPASLETTRLGSAVLAVSWQGGADILYYSELNTTSTHTESCPTTWREVSVPEGSTIYNLGGLSSNASYNICITATTSEHFYSDCACLSVAAPVIWVTSVTLTSISVTWSIGGSGGISYLLLWAPMSDLTNQRDLTITDGSTNTTLTGLEDDTVYHFTVMATDDATESVGPSNIVIARTVAGLPLEICLSGFFNCTDMVANFPSASLTEDISSNILRESNVTAENVIIDKEISCPSEITNSLFFKATVVDYLRAGSQSWVSGGPFISVSGVLMTVAWGDCVSCPDLTSRLCDIDYLSCVSTQSLLGTVSSTSTISTTEATTSSIAKPNPTSILPLVCPTTVITTANPSTPSATCPTTTVTLANPAYTTSACPTTTVNPLTSSACPISTVTSIVTVVVSPSTSASNKTPSTSTAITNPPSPSSACFTSTVTIVASPAETSSTVSVESTETLTKPRSTDVPTCDCTQFTPLSGSVGLSVGVGIGAGLILILVAGAAILIPFCLLKYRRRSSSYALKQSNMDTSSNMAYGMTIINRDTALNDANSEHNYDVIINQRTQQDTLPTPPTPPTLPRGELTAAQDGGADTSSYEVNTPTNIRQMRIQRASQPSAGDVEEGEEEEKELYSQIPSNI